MPTLWVVEICSTEAVHVAWKCKLISRWSALDEQPDLLIARKANEKMLFNSPPLIAVSISPSCKGTLVIVSQLTAEVSPFLWLCMTYSSMGTTLGWGWQPCCCADSVAALVLIWGYLYVDSFGDPAAATEFMPWLVLVFEVICWQGLTCQAPRMRWCASFEGLDKSAHKCVCLHRHFAIPHAFFWRLSADNVRITPLTSNVILLNSPSAFTAYLDRWVLGRPPRRRYTSRWFCSWWVSTSIFPMITWQCLLFCVRLCCHARIWWKLMLWWR